MVERSETFAMVTKMKINSYNHCGGFQPSDKQENSSIVLLRKANASSARFQVTFAMAVSLANGDEIIHCKWYFSYQ